MSATEPVPAPQESGPGTYDTIAARLIAAHIWLRNTTIGWAVGVAITPFFAWFAAMPVQGVPDAGTISGFRAVKEGAPGLSLLIINLPYPAAAGWPVLAGAVLAYGLHAKKFRYVAAAAVLLVAFAVPAAGAFQSSTFLGVPTGVADYIAWTTFAATVVAGVYAAVLWRANDVRARLTQVINVIPNPLETGARSTEKKTEKK